MHEASTESKVSATSCESPVNKRWEIKDGPVFELIRASDFV